jgi:hypothetical protein
MNSEHDQAGTEISTSRGATAFLLTPVQREKYLLRLDPGRFDEATLQLAALNDSTVGLFIIA